MKVLPRSAPVVGATHEQEVLVRRTAWADNLKVVLVAGVIVAHSTMAWTGVGNWVFKETPVREPLLSVLVIISVVVTMFGMSLFFLISGYFTPRSLRRKGVGRFVGDRAVRLLVPMVAYVVLLSPPIEFVDPDNEGWAGGFWAFVPNMLSRPAPGPTWFLGILFLFSVVYALVRSARPDRGRSAGAAPRLRYLLVGAIPVAAASYLIMIPAPLGEEVLRLAVAQAPGWVAGFTIGLLAAERGWLPLDRDAAQRIRTVALLSVAACVAVIIVSALTGMSMELFVGRGTWQSGVLAVVAAVMVMTVPLWLVDVFQRRVDRQGARGRVLSRAAFGAFLIHQGVLVALVLGARTISWPPEAAYVTVSALGVAISFGLGWLLTRVPGISRIV